MNLIKENLEFKRGLDSKKALSVGRYSHQGKKRRAEELQEKLQYVSADAMETFIENINEYEIAIENLKNVGVPVDEIAIVLPKAKIRILNYKIIRGNTVIGNVLLKSDAKFMIKNIIKYDCNDIDPEYIYAERESTGQYFLIQELKDFFKRRGWEWKE